MQILKDNTNPLSHNEHVLVLSSIKVLKDLMYKRMKQASYLTLLTKINLKWTKDFSVTPEIIKLLHRKKSSLM